jgi:hypothetical protein
MIVQALGASDEIDESERDNPGTTAYMDYLKRVYDVDIEGTDPAQAFFIGQSETPSAAGQFVDRISSDPLKGRGEDGELDELSAGGKSSGISPLVSAGEVDRLLVELTPAQGGGPSGQVDDGAQDTTPSAPTP